MGTIPRSQHAVLRIADLTSPLAGPSAAASPQRAALAL